jgi:L-ornithine N5-monooxygenase
VQRSLTTYRRDFQVRKRHWFSDSGPLSRAMILLCMSDYTIYQLNFLLKFINSVNEIFDPAQTANVFKRDTILRKESIAFSKGTNYGVVRQELIERIYENLYLQALHTDSKNRHQIFRYRTILDAGINSAGTISLKFHNATSLYEKSNEPLEEISEFDIVILATGYVRDTHFDIMGSLKHLLPEHLEPNYSSGWPVLEDYRVPFDDNKVDGSKAGVWMQGCNESTHGVGQSISYHVFFLSIWSILTLE